MTTADPCVDEGQRRPLLDICQAMVRLYKENLGRGPTKARAEFAGRDILVVWLEGSLTVAERKLAAMGEHARLREARLFGQYALEAESRAAVERVLERRTTSFISGIDTGRDISSAVFGLEPQR